MALLVDVVVWRFVLERCLSDERFRFHLLVVAVVGWLVTS